MLQRQWRAEAGFEVAHVQGGLQEAAVQVARTRRYVQVWHGRTSAVCDMARVTTAQVHEGN